MSGTLTMTEKECLARLATGDHDAFHAIYDQYHPHVYATALRILQSPAAAEDALQEIFLKVWVNREELAGMSYFPAWLQTVVRNHLYNQLRQRAASEKHLMYLLREEAVAAQPVYAEAEFRELSQLVEQAVRALSPQQRRVFELTRVKGLKHREVAEAMNLSTETVKKYIMDALRQVRAHLAASGRAVPVVVLISLLKL